MFYRYTPELEESLSGIDYLVGFRGSHGGLLLFPLPPKTERKKYMAIVKNFRTNFEERKVKLNSETKKSVCAFCIKSLACQFSDRKCDVKIEDIS
jgi:hypothetical protein